MQISCDGVVHNPLGGASYIFEKELMSYIQNSFKKNKLKIWVGSQPNSSPHFGTLETIALAFSLAKKIKTNDVTKDVTILYEMVDTAPYETTSINGITYQKNLRFTPKDKTYMGEYLEILNYYKELTKIDYEIKYEQDFNKLPETKQVLNTILDNRKYVAEKLDQKYGNLRVRMSCPICGLADKNCINNSYKENTITFLCPYHNEYSINLDKDISKLEFNAPLIMLMRTMIFSLINQSNTHNYETLMIYGSDYAGFFQEELIYKVAAALGYDASKFPMIMYAPLVTDWSGAKLSKSLYVSKNAYNDIPKMFVNYHFLKENLGFKGLDILYRIVNTWIDNPYMMFRHYSIYYFIEEFKKHLTSDN